MSGMKEPESTISDQGSFESSGEGVRAFTTTHTVVTRSRASVHRGGDAYTVAHTEYSAGAGESIRDAAIGGCDSGDGLDDKSSTGVEVSTSVDISMENLVGSGSGDGKVGVPANNYNGIPVSPVKKGKKKKKGNYISPGRARFLGVDGTTSIVDELGLHTSFAVGPTDISREEGIYTVDVLQQKQQQKQQQSLSPGATEVLERLNMQRQQQRSAMTEAPETLSQLQAQVQRLLEMVDKQQGQIEDLKEALVVSQKSTPFKARIAFEEDVKVRLRELEQKLVEPEQLASDAEDIESERIDALESSVGVLTRNFDRSDRILHNLLLAQSERWVLTRRFVEDVKIRLNRVEQQLAILEPQRY